MYQRGDARREGGAPRGSPEGVGDLLRLEMGHGARGSLRAGIHEGVSGVVPQGGKRPGGVADVLRHTPRQVCQQLQGSCREERLTRHIRQLRIRPACNTHAMKIATLRSGSMRSGCIPHMYERTL